MDGFSRLDWRAVEIEAREADRRLWRIGDIVTTQATGNNVQGWREDGASCSDIYWRGREGKRAADVR